MLKRMTARQFREWQAFFKAERILIEKAEAEAKQKREMGID